MTIRTHCFHRFLLDDEHIHNAHAYHFALAFSSDFMNRMKIWNPLRHIDDSCLLHTYDAITEMNPFEGTAKAHNNLPLSFHVHRKMNAKKNI